DHGHVPAAALDAEYVPFLAENVLRRGLQRGVAAAVQHKPRFATQKPRGVDPEREIAGYALGGIVADEFFGFAVVPEILHLTSCCCWCRRQAGPSSGGNAGWLAFVRLCVEPLKQPFRDARGRDQVGEEAAVDGGKQ